MAAPDEEPRCGRCGAAFLAFRRGVPCPSCGVPSDREAPIVRAVLRAYAENVRILGRPVPSTIRVANTWDDYLYRGLFFLKALDSRRPRETDEAVVDRILQIPEETSAPGWRAHLVDFYREIARARRAAEREK